MPDDEQQLKDPMDVYREYPERRSFSAGASGESEYGGEASIQIEGELPNNVSTSEDDLRGVTMALFHTVFGNNAAQEALFASIDGEPDEEAVEAATKEFAERWEAINAEAEARAGIASKVIQEAIQRRREAQNN